MCEVTIKNNAVRFNQRTGTGSINIHGKLEVIDGVDDPVIEIFNAVQHRMETAIWESEKKRLIHFTPLFPTYDAEKDLTIYQILPTKYAEASDKQFLAEAKLTLDIFYKNLFTASFRQFLEDANKICNYNGYSLYKECIKHIREANNPEKREYDIYTTRMLLENFIQFLGLPLPKSKEECERKAALASLEQLKTSKIKNERLHQIGRNKIVDLLNLEEELDELFAYGEDA